MKPAPFEYARAASVAEALDLLADDDALALAGGQSLVAMLNLRLARPSLLVDLNPVSELSGVQREGQAVRIGAMTRQAELERNPILTASWPLLGQAVRHVAHPAIRNRGTIGGSVAQADPKAELPVALTALDARFHLRSPAGERTLGPAEMFRGPMRTALGPGELLCAVELAPLPEGACTGFAEYARTHGDFALAGAAVAVAPGWARVALLGAGPTPVRATAAEQALIDGAEPHEAAALADGLAGSDHQGALISAVVASALERALA